MKTKSSRILGLRFSKVLCSFAALLFAEASFADTPSQHSIARFWNEEILAAIRIDRPHPPVHARNLFTLSAAMYDAWAAYDPKAVGYIYHRKHTHSDIAAARREAISYAAYRILTERFALSVNYRVTLARLDAQFASLGYDTNNVSTDASMPSGVGNSVAAAVSEWFLSDGSRQANNYRDTFPELGGYQPVNDYLVAGIAGIVVSNVNRWQPLAIADAVDQNGLPAGPTQTFLGSQWLYVRPFALSRPQNGIPWMDPGPPPFHGTETHAEFISNVVVCIQKSAELDPADGVTMDISPGKFGNNSLGANDGQGRAINPVTGAPYEPNVVLRADFARALTEYWADGPESETPPGHWNVVANQVADTSGFQKRIGGTGPVVDDLEWDIKVCFALNASVHDAACAAWSLKRYYDGWRPISAVRYVGSLGQSSDAALPGYNPLGLPLIPGLIELVTPETARIGGRHEGLSVNRLAIRAWPGQPKDPKTEVSGVKWVRPTEWMTYQRRTFVSPAFPGYVSGHSTFSRAAAEVMTAITGSEYFPGGLGTHLVRAGALIHEKGPTADLVLQTATYYDAADMAGISRIWGGIHPPADDFNGRIIGSACGKEAWKLAKQYFDGSIAEAETLVAIRELPGIGCELRYHPVRGLQYQLQVTSDLSEPFMPMESLARAENNLVLRTNAFVGTRNFFRVARVLNP